MSLLPPSSGVIHIIMPGGHLYVAKIHKASCMSNSYLTIGYQLNFLLDNYEDPLESIQEIILGHYISSQCNTNMYYFTPEIRTPLIIRSPRFIPVHTALPLKSGTRNSTKRTL